MTTGRAQHTTIYSGYLFKDQRIEAHHVSLTHDGIVAGRQDASSTALSRLNPVPPARQCSHIPRQIEPGFHPAPAMAAKKKVRFKTSPERSRIMSRVKGRNNRSTELVLLAALRRNGIRGWRRQLRIPGSPDFAFRAQKVAVFVDGCFWHGCPRCYSAPKANARFWAEKVRYNIRHDRKVARELRSRGWLVVRIWEHSLRNPDNAALRIGRLVQQRST